MIGLVHLVWGPLGPEPLARFLESYRSHPAGANHELVILWNGTTRDQREELDALVNGIAHRSLTLSEPVQDLAAYRVAADQLTHERLCFLNSHSVIAAEDWLGKLDAALSPTLPAIAGATGSWMSVRSAYLHLLGLPTGYRSVLPPRRAILAEMRQMNAELRAEGGATTPAPLRTRLELAIRRMARSPGFPTPHVRTNGFLLRRELFLQLVSRQPRDKLDAYGLEAGPDSLTAQVLGAVGEAQVVNRAGDAFSSGAWHTSGTFWQGGQERLLMTDNQTRIYARGGHSRRQLLAGWAWGGANAADEPPRAA